MTANRSTAVMQRRRATAPESLDYFPTPPFATRALCEFLEGEGYPIATQMAWEPACGEGHMVRPLAERFASVRASDVYRYGDHDLVDFTITGHTEPQADWIITNPPFRVAEHFIGVGLDRARVGVAMLVRSAFLEGEGRQATLFRHTPPSFALQFVERVVMLEGRLIRRGAVDPFHAKPGGKATSATSYCWLVWLHDRTGDTRLRWIPASLTRLERPGDYPVYAKDAA